MHCRAASAHEFRTRLGFKQYDVILTKEQSNWNNKFIEGGNMKAECSVLSYRIYSYFHDYKLPWQIDENGLSDRNIDYEIKIQKVIEKGLGCKFSRIDTGKIDFDIFWVINEIFKHIKQSTKKI